MPVVFRRVFSAVDVSISEAAQDTVGKLSETDGEECEEEGTINDECGSDLNKNQ